jgi:hypothetical protein
MTSEQNDAIVRRAAEAAARLLRHGEQGTTFEVPELGETWTISREPS